MAAPRVEAGVLGGGVGAANRARGRLYAAAMLARGAFHDFHRSVDSDRLWSSGSGATWMHGLGRHVNNLDERIEHLEKDSRALKEAHDELVGRLDALLEYLQERAAR